MSVIHVSLIWPRRSLMKISRVSVDLNSKSNINDWSNFFEASNVSLINLRGEKRDEESKWKIHQTDDRHDPLWVSHSFSCEWACVGWCKIGFGSDIQLVFVARRNFPENALCSSQRFAINCAVNSIESSIFVTMNDYPSVPFSCRYRDHQCCWQANGMRAVPAESEAKTY